MQTSMHIWCQIFWSNYARAGKTDTTDTWMSVLSDVLESVPYFLLSNIRGGCNEVDFFFGKKWLRSRPFCQTYDTSPTLDISLFKYVFSFNILARWKIKYSSICTNFPYPSAMQDSRIVHFYENWRISNKLTYNIFPRLIIRDPPLGDQWQCCLNWDPQHRS